MPEILPTPRITDAARVAALRELLPTSLGTAELRDQLAIELRANALFASRCTNAIVLAKIKEVVDHAAQHGENLATMRWEVLQVLRAVGYTPEGGFPDAEPGEDVPPAIKGTLQDLSSRQRLDLILRTQMALVRGRGQQLRGMQAARMAAYPAWRLIRIGTVRAPRNWDGTEEDNPNGDEARWIVAGGKIRAGQMVAYKGDPIWGELGSSGNFSDALDTDHPPFAFNSKMGWVEVSAADCKKLGVTGPDGETMDEWLAKEHPLITGSQPALDAPVISLADVPADLKKGIPEVDGMATLPSNLDALREKLRARISQKMADRRARLDAADTARKGGRS